MEGNTDFVNGALYGKSKEIDYFFNFGDDNHVGSHDTFF